jgi:hypothetical protein
VFTADGGEQAGSEVDLELDGSGIIQGTRLATSRLLRPAAGNFKPKW